MCILNQTVFCPKTQCGLDLLHISLEMDCLKICQCVPAGFRNLHCQPMVIICVIETDRFWGFFLIMPCMTCINQGSSHTCHICNSNHIITHIFTYDRKIEYAKNYRKGKGCQRVFLIP